MFLLVTSINATNISCTASKSVGCSKDKPCKTKISSDEDFYDMRIDYDIERGIYTRTGKTELTFTDVKFESGGGYIIGRPTISTVFKFNAFDNSYMEFVTVSHITKVYFGYCVVNK